MTLPTLLERARQGDAHAIARLITRASGEQGVVASAQWRGSELHLSLEADQPLPQAQIVPTIRRGFKRLGLTCPMERVVVTSRQVGQPHPDWQESFELDFRWSEKPALGDGEPASPSSPTEAQIIPVTEAEAETSPPEPISSPYLSDTALVSLAHVAPLFSYLVIATNGLIGFPFFWGGSFLLPWRVVAPLLLLLVQGADQRSAYIQQQTKEALNFQLSMVIAWIITIALMFVLVGFLLAIPLALFEIVWMIIAAVKASEGKPFRYPLRIRFVR
ncbi:MAG: DUF4870 domain-containing protein [Leptolyngbyaceae cyanobacterium SM2_3_12]|nr:DUF4870 domain-containing protein [Leptolyngbyaceae cyanobacterium SM2_3_12]